MSSNSFNIPGLPSGGSLIDMDYFDDLPGEFRDLLNYAPAKFSAWKVASDIRDYGRFEMLLLYGRQMRALFPDWTPVSTDPEIGAR